jgi:hypothetical protein
MTIKLEAGQEHRAKFPFLRTTYEKMPDDIDGTGLPVDTPTWRPGVEDCCNQYSSWSEAHGEGEVIYSVVATFKPGKYPERVFYLRNWVDPDGKRFGKNNLRITTAQNFRELIKGWRHDYELTDAEAA